MGYRIVYGQGAFPEKNRRKSWLRLMTAGFALAFVILTRCCWPRGTEILREVLLPRENAAFQRLTEDIRAGEPMGDAVTAFCRQIVEEAFAQAG